MNLSTVAPISPAALARDDAAAYLALSTTTFELLVREEDIPAPRQLSGRRVAWIRSELDAWLADRPRSKLLPPENTSAPKPRAQKHAANDAAMQPIAPGGQKAA